MSLRRTTPLAFHPRGLSDALDSSLIFSGAMTALRDLIPDPSTKGLWQCRPASIQLGNMAGSNGAFGDGYSSGFLIATGGPIPAPLGVVSCLLIVGNVAYGMVGSGNQDYPFAFNLVTNTFLPVGGVVTNAIPGTTNLPNKQLESGDWTPPTMDVIASTIMVTHPGFGGTGNWLGTIDITDPLAPVWSAGNIITPSSITSAAAAAGGSGYAVGDAIALSNGVELVVSTVSGTAVATVSLAASGSATVIPGNPVPQTLSSGFGLGASFNLTWAVRPGGFAFSSATGVPVAVKAFNGRAWWAYNPASGPAVTVFSDVLTPTVITNAGTVQAVAYDDNVAITALGALPLSNQLGGIIQSLMVFKGTTNIYQVTGDITAGPGPPLGTLTRNSLNVATGTFAPNSLAVTSKGLAFVAPDGVRIIDFNANVGDPIGLEGTGKTLPFMLAVSPSRIAAAANGTVYRVTVQDGSRSGSPIAEYWMDIARGGIWSGPHSFPARVIKSYKNTFVLSPFANPATLYQSDYLQSLSSTFVENNVPMQFSWLTTLLPDTDQMCENAMLETTIYLGLAASASYIVQALDEGSSVLGTVTLMNPTSATIWGQFNWGQADWGAQPSALFPQRLPWSRQIVFRRLAMNVMGPASQQFRIGTMHLKYEKLGYLQQPPAIGSSTPAPPPDEVVGGYITEDAGMFYVDESGTVPYVVESP